MWSDPQSLIAQGDKLQDKLCCSVARLEHPDGTFVWKHHNWGSRWRTLKRSLSQSPAEKSWEDARFLYAAGVSTPRPRAYLERRFGPFNRHSYFLTDYIAGTSLYRFLRFEKPAREFIYQLARQVATIWQQLDDLCVWHNDFKTENLLIDRQGKVWLIDFERMRRFTDRQRLRRRQIRDLQDFFHPRNWRQNPAAAEAFRSELVKTAALRETLSGDGGTSHPLAKPLRTTNKRSQLVSVVIPCRNAAHSIEACVDSARDIADEIVVADAGSTDGTLPLVQSLGGCRIIQRSCDDDVVFAKWAESHARHPWIFRLLPHEQLNSELGRQIQDAVATDPAYDGFRVSRNVYFRGHRLKFGGFTRELSIRLYRRGAARHELRDGHVEVVVDRDKVGALASRLWCELSADLERAFHDAIGRAKQAATNRHHRGIHPTRRRALGWASWRLLQSLLLRWGWLDGWAGVHASCLSALQDYMCEAMLWELWQPAFARRIVVRDSWQGLKLFDPSTNDSVPAAPANAEDVAETQPLRHAA
jgi:hypothetical protein